ncbi:MAG: hypothetical protein A3B89_04445 [Candidatus Buchananbacteria bacterium RIFCSPHIGHO2_02_FULL_40_13]|uniref:Glycosyltransferase RgtA/B/C/D-like domain-containing protein n=1 Tax=Candidatus Buchananbacteria bacterium RIFCSPLOWO2_01_FULL_39_33 TaxID=1797543 RepID=A0A1G1YGN1_9BACT|nr:MAG: hypothetical protein A2820_00415 [Candidatus Buchananbacteria bacterium RIFCSPHIGHO2_01_FULL_40_35]OGY49051.1 MAG: hypothetical protein A3B89_04445 [Candidatus Buchananbacteria bacterium RIFCSPHIGHO2_02_FULL_40_13]OGY51492.1 MAG: hypothetical protein A3A02_03720 [Candidatus Buchananbacteria bacterium RIFCSPLOWO2_01_FULL_39_33]
MISVLFGKKFYFMNSLKTISKRLANHQAIAGLLLFLLVLAFFSWLEYAPTLADPDSFYHAKMTALISENGLVRDFPYLQFTTLKDGYIDHHLLYHLYLIPFVKIFPLPVGLKIGHSLLAALVLATLYWLLTKLKVRGAWGYTVFLLLVEPFIFRLSLVKAQPLSLIILLLGTYLIIRKKFLGLTLLSFIYVWSYGGWFLILIITAIYVLVESWDRAWLKIRADRLAKIINFKNKKTDLINRLYAWVISFIKNALNSQNFKLVTSVLLGLVLGLVINPYFPKNLEFYWIHIIKIALINYQGVIGVGAEWYPYNINDFFINNLLPFILALVALAVFLNYHQKFDVVVKYFLALFLAFVIATAKARRNVEYLAPLAVIFSALVFSRGWSLDEIRGDFQAFGRLFKKVFLNDWRAKVLFTLFSILTVTVIFYKMPYQAKKSLDNGFNYNYLKSASEYLLANSQPGDIVFQSDWDEFPILFYHNSRNYYIVGLDPTFMYLKNPDLYNKWADITRGQRAEDIYGIIKNDFRAKYVIATLDHKELIANLDNNFYFAKVYSDNEAVIYKVL